MFTGIVQKLATVIEMKKLNAESYRLRISNPYAADVGKVVSVPDALAASPESASPYNNAAFTVDQIQLGESIANNGVCLTVTDFSPDFLQFDLAPVTIEVTALSRLKAGSKVNLERSLRMGDRLSGHWVQGHVDGKAKVTKLESTDEDFYNLEIEPPESLLRYCVSKGSLCIEGISLTIQKLGEKTLSFQIIPHTWMHTDLSDLAIGDLVNIEVDLLAKYIERFQEYDQNRAVRK
jgi:riboflavin synthase